ncbi:hypothetical protein Leryth_020834 [Lithospermum erythrorhizon]|nr:hypothetical protein Leryth_020834 [Lithospermum erythrorhizon]
MCFVQKILLNICPFILNKQPMVKKPCIKHQLNMMLILLFFQLLFLNVKAQSHSSDLVPEEDVVSNFQPSLAVVIGILCIMFSLTFLLLLYAKCCYRSQPFIDNGRLRIQDGLLRSSSRLSGIDKTVVESLPFFRFSALKGSRKGLECAVCLSKFEDIEILRQKVSIEDVSLLKNSQSMRFLWNCTSELRDESNLELYVEREESHHHGIIR